MVKTLRITLDDDEYEYLKKIKGNKTWKELLLSVQSNSFEQKQIEPGKINELYVRVAEVLLELTSLYEDELEKRHLKGAALVPMFAAGAKLTEEEKKEAGLASLSVIEKLIKEKTNDLDLLSEVKWIIQSLRMLILGHFKAYELSLSNLAELRREHSSLD